VAEPEATPGVPRRVFITGALGFIGRHLVGRDRAAGAEVAGMDVRAEPVLGIVAGDLTEQGGWQDAASGAKLTLLGYEPVVDLDQGMRRSEEWLRRERLLT
jgi:nucleoside-diphosphate-sugar epimerase